MCTVDVLHSNHGISPSCAARCDLFLPSLCRLLASWRASCTRKTWDFKVALSVKPSCLLLVTSDEWYGQLFFKACSPISRNPEDYFFPKVFGPSIQRAVPAAPAMQPTAFASAGLLVSTDGRHRCTTLWKTRRLTHVWALRFVLLWSQCVQHYNTTSLYFGTSCAFSHRVPGFRLPCYHYVALRSDLRIDMKPIWLKLCWFGLYYF